MSIKQIGNPDPKYLAATDVLIGDMSDINYEFLIYDRPIILLANQWLKKNFPDIGIKTDLLGLEDAIRRSLESPGEFKNQRKKWLDRTMHLPDGNSSSRVIDAILRESGMDNPLFLMVHGNNEVLKTHLDLLIKAVKDRGLYFKYTAAAEDFLDAYKSKDIIIISPANKLLKDLDKGYRVHIDHGVKGPGTTDMKSLIDQYKGMDYFKSVDLHITEGEASLEKTRKILGPLKDRTIMVGYPKADSLLALDNSKNRSEVCEELSFDPGKPIITYAPAAKCSYPWKQGASLTNEVLDMLGGLSKRIDANFLIKLKSTPIPISIKILNRFKKLIGK